MTTENTTAQPKRKSRKAVKALLAAGVLLAATLVTAHFVWKYSGSNEWVLELERDGVKVYSLKAPGTTLKRFKAVTRIRATMNSIVAGMTDPTTEACREFVPGCTSGDILEPWSPQSQRFIQAYRVVFPRPFSPRDLVIETQFSQDSQSKALLVQCTARQDLRPLNDCCFRVTNMHNSWKYTPLDNGEIEVEFLGNYDSGLPYFVFNRAVPYGLSTLLKRLEKFFNKDKYQGTEFAFVREPARQ